MEAAGAMGMSEQEFLDCSPRYFFARHRGFVRHHERQQQEAWERARYLAFYTLSPHAKKGRLKKLSDLGRFPWEKKPAPAETTLPERTPEQRAADTAEFIARAKRWHEAQNNAAHGR